MKYYILKVLDSMWNKDPVFLKNDFVCNVFHQQPVLEIYIMKYLKETKLFWESSWYRECILMVKIVIRINLLTQMIHFYANASDKERKSGSKISSLLPSHQSIQRLYSLAWSS